ncbi:MAG: 2-C-methyl-D-erythritol 4-phosphate cytidylyltransferase [Rikenellaceae bacterium]
MKNLAVIIVAGGSGQRMGSTTPKQFLLIDGLPILVRTLMAFSDAAQRVVVLPEDHIPYWNELLEKYRITFTHTIVGGGKTRFQSVSNGLKAIDPNIGFIAVHDGVRPFVTTHVIENTLECAKEHSAAIPVIEVSDTIRQIDNQGASHTLQRDRLRAVQTPQIFARDLLLSAYEQEELSSFTDDASVVEQLGEHVALAQGDPKNIKITYPSDIQ